MRHSVPTGGVLVLSLGGLFGCHQAAEPSQARRSEVTPYVRRDATSPANAINPPNASEPVSSSPAPAAPGTALALAQRATTYAQSVGPAVADRRQKPRSGNSDWPDPDAMRLTPQFETVVPKAVANAQTPESEPAQSPSTPANASVDLPTVHKLVSAAPRPQSSAPVAKAADTDSTAVRIAARARDYPADLSAQVDDQLARFLREESVPDVSTLGGLAPEDRELLSAFMDALSNFRSQLRADGNMLFSKKIHPLVELSDRLSSQAELSVPTVALCTGVHAYGVYEPMDPARFIAGKPQEAIVYCEVENFLSQPNEKNLYETRLTQDIVLYEEASGVPAWHPPKETIVDQARRRRHDFFLNKRVVLPPNLTIGRYLLKVTIEDQQARHIAENTTPVEIVAQ